MKEISVILKNNMLITVEEFIMLDRYSCAGRLWALTQFPTRESPFTLRIRTIEYIFDPEALTLFGIISGNILATWDTDTTRDLGPTDEFEIRDSMFIRPIAGKVT